MIKTKNLLVKKKKNLKYIYNSTIYNKVKNLKLKNFIYKKEKKLFLSKNFFKINLTTSYKFNKNFFKVLNIFNLLKKFKSLKKKKFKKKKLFKFFKKSNFLKKKNNFLKKKKKIKKNNFLKNIYSIFKKPNIKKFNRKNYVNIFFYKNKKIF